MDELAVGMVGEVEQREGVALRTQKAGVIVEAVEEPVQGPGSGARAEAPQARPAAEASPQDRAEELDLQGGCR